MALMLTETLVAYFIIFYKKKLELECGPMPNVMATQPNIGGALCESSIIPLLILCYKVWLTAAAQVPCSNTANIGEHKTWTLSEFCKIPLGTKSPKMYGIYIKERKGRVFI